jgi:hypothetical protein
MRNPRAILPPPWCPRARVIRRTKATVEGTVKILVRYVRFRHRRTRFTSLAQINQAIAEYDEHINARRHTRLPSRSERFESVECAALKPLPVQNFDVGGRKEAALHADCYVLVEAVLYSAPHAHRHKELRIKRTRTASRYS